MRYSFLFLVVLTAFAQDPAVKDPVVPYPFNGISADLPLPGGADAWVVDVVTRGGLDGRGSGDYRITSEGKFSTSIRDVTRDKNIPKEALETFAAFIPPAVKVSWGESSFGTCMDCFANLIRLKVRDRDGKTQSFTAYWDVTTQRRVPEEVIRLFNAVVALGK